MVLLSTLPVYADFFSVNSQPEKSVIYNDDFATYQVTIKNELSNSDRVQVYSLDPSWVVIVEDLDGSLIRLNGYETKKFTFILDPSNTIRDGEKYGVPVVFESLETGEKINVRMQVTVNSNQYRTYQPALIADIVVGDGSGKIDPSKPFDVKVRVLNRNPLDIKELKVSVVSPIFKEEFVTSLKPIGSAQDQVTKILTFSLDPLIAPQKGMIDVSLLANNISLGIVQSKDFEVIASQSSFLRETLVDTNTNLYQDYTVRLTNPNNVITTEKVLLKTSLLQRWFLKANFVPQFVQKDGQTYAEFSVTLEPNESYELRLTRDYRPALITLVVGLVLIVIGIIMYYTLRSPIVVNKKIHVIEKQQGGSVSRLKVVLHVKSRVNKSLDQVRIIERVPTITEVEDSFSVGTIRPAKIVRSPSKGTLVRWEFASLEPFEERIITYTVASKLSILGSFSLPATVVKYDYGGHTKTVTQSMKIDD